ncbi:MAG: hypothetical protein E7385_05010 [Ruminococcaceae bacterium]|nr:hypothetical protein [Oscillospiraceae bacterium]
MLIKILLLVFLALVATLLVFILYSKVKVSARVCGICAVCCALALIVGGVFMLWPASDDNPGIPPEPTEVPGPADRSEGGRVMDFIMWYDIDTGPTTNGRPQKGWWPLNPNHPEAVKVDGNYRTTTPLMGLYDQRDPETARQHLYWMSALGCNGVAVDWTNYTSHRFALKESGAGWYKYTLGVYKNTEVLLNVASVETSFEAPKSYCVVRLQGNNEEGLRRVLEDVYTLYQQTPNAYYKFNDGSDRADKPFVVIFIDSSIREKLVAGEWSFDDERFNIRFSNGYLTASTTLEEDGTRSIPGNVPLWLFVEAEEDPDAGVGQYRTYHKDSPDGGVEQMIAWASVHKGGFNWDTLNNIIDGKTTFERTLRNVKEMSPKAVLINRFNYAMAWKAEPQEGVSLYGSTHIEPNEDFGFLIFDNVKKNLYELNEWNKHAPVAPAVASVEGNKVFIGLDEFPTEYRVSLTQDNMGEWVYYNINDGIEIPSDWSGKTCYIQTRNTFGESTVSEINIA